MDWNGETESECCACTGEILEQSYTCADKKTVLTQREQEVLARIREASAQARKIKELLRDCSMADGGSVEAERELERLRLLRKDLENERIEAAQERMRLLGHL